jgi:hypothetical protein
LVRAVDLKESPKKTRAPALWLERLRSINQVIATVEKSVQVMEALDVAADAADDLDVPSYVIGSGAAPLVVAVAVSQGKGGLPMGRGRI